MSAVDAARGRRGTGRLRRGSVTAFVARHELAWELSLGIVALLYFGAGLTVDADVGPTVVAAAIALVLGVTLAVEFALRCWDAPSRLVYLRYHWLDLIACLPILGGLRVLRLLRVFRLVIVGRMLMSMDRAAVSKHGGQRDSFWFLIPAFCLIWFSAATACWAFEHAVNPQLRQFSSALYWALITVSTVGYGDVAPVTTAGRVVAGLLVITGIGLVSFVSARLTQLWLRREDDRVHLARHVEQLERHLDEIRRLVEPVHRAIVKDPPDAVAENRATTTEPGSREESISVS